MTSTTATATAPTISADDIAVGSRILYPCQSRTGTNDLPRTVSGIVEYPATRVLYFAEGLYGIVDRGIELRTATAAEVGHATIVDVCIDDVVETVDRLVRDDVARWEVVDMTTIALVCDDEGDRTATILTAYADQRDVDLSAVFWQLHEHY